MVLSSGTLKLIVLFAALTCAHTLQCYSYSFYKGIGGFTKEPSHIVTCPYSNYCMRLNGVIHTGSHSRLNLLFLFSIVLLSTTHTHTHIKIVVSLRLISKLFYQHVLCIKRL
ncbi:hypothetical protein Tcan_08366 [Toxocara canis]|uniref:Secreted protein n=1 Tax=Toxocara canis TaxID=6265 RepID=A0A0B2VZY0_TOXCA|nr:hypothetical protein Tcan_08366 [Toxocara canis]